MARVPDITTMPSYSYATSTLLLHDALEAAIGTFWILSLTNLSASTIPHCKAYKALASLPSREETVSPAWPPTSPAPCGLGMRPCHLTPTPTPPPLPSTCKIQCQAHNHIKSPQLPPIPHQHPHTARYRHMHSQPQARALAQARASKPSTSWRSTYKEACSMRAARCERKSVHTIQTS